MLYPNPLLQLSSKWRKFLHQPHETICEHDLLEIFLHRRQVNALALQLWTIVRHSAS
uniref:Uncharacterized protein n=1 Tax=Arundo donax TaxID=35708 RepID=A0A0A9HBA0_ARUDO